MKSQEIKSRYIEFFKKRGHTHVESSSLIPHNDPTLLFTNAGMNQFKSYFVRAEQPPFTRAVTIQKCVRAGGKHNDLENVGHTARHHTFFEMLGNFSFGDYFKHEAIRWAWDFLTVELNIPADRLYVTVHYSDDEARNIWHNEIGLPEDRIFNKGDKDNFWEVGDVGPCGPCSEIFYDHGPEHATPGFVPGPGEDILDDDQRYVEIWNLVFTQYDNTPEGRKPLPKPCVDTGAGLERLAAVCQGKYFNYDTDVFECIFKRIEELVPHKYSEERYKPAFRVVADHIRSCTMLITDGIVPSNEGRGYVLRRIIRRAIKYLRDLGAKDVLFYKLVGSVFESFGDQYPENRKNQELAEKLLKLEEEKFLETLGTGLKFLEQAKSEMTGTVLSGDVAFKLYDTYGFPVDFTEMLLAKNKMSVDVDGFEAAMAKRKEESRKSWKGGSALSDKVFYEAKENFGETFFVGYDHDEVKAKLNEIIEMGDRYGLVFETTCFYGESGGQTGDVGEIYEDGVIRAKIIDTQKPVSGLFVHITKDASNLTVNKTYTLKINKELRNRSMCNHSATHLLQAALQKVLGTHVKQSGSYVDPERLRFDFTHTQAMTKAEIEKVEDLVNEMIGRALPITCTEMPKDEALKLGAMALFGEKYGNIVRVVKMGDVSTELCGGTHAQNTLQLRAFSIINETSVSTGIRRIEAVSGMGAIERFDHRSDILANLETMLNAKNETVIDRVKGLENDIKDKSKLIQELGDKLRAFASKELFQNPETIRDNLVFKPVIIKEETDLRQLSDNFVDKFDNGVLLLILNRKGKLSALLRRGKKVNDVDCAKILRASLQKLNGRGGGKPDMAQGSGDYDHIEEFINDIRTQL